MLCWLIETIRARFEETCRDEDVEPSERVAAFLNVDATEEQDAAIERFWSTVAANLRLNGCA